MKTFEINNTQYGLTHVSAVAVGAGRSERQEAMLVTSTTKSGSSESYVVLGRDILEPGIDADLLSEVIKKRSLWLSDPETLSTVLPLSETRLYMLRVGDDIAPVCRCGRSSSGRVFSVIRHDGVRALIIDGEKVEVTEENIEKAARIADRYYDEHKAEILNSANAEDPYYGDAENGSSCDIQILNASTRPVRCANCPLFWECRDMDK